MEAGAQPSRSPEKFWSVPSRNLPLSGGAKAVWKDERIWYRAIIFSSDRCQTRRLLLAISVAVDWESQGFSINRVNLLVKHRGGFDAFQLSTSRKR